MGLFSKPKCPKCGMSDQVVRSTDCTTTASWECNRCIKASREARQRESEIDKLNQRISELENKLKQ